AIRCPTSVDLPLPSDPRMPKQNMCFSFSKDTFQEEDYQIFFPNANYSHLDYFFLDDLMKL
ncbi:MAG: hypothetical protein ACREGR_04850, partial [Minisyncoccia bacterium]